MLRPTTNGVGPAEKPMRIGPISGTFRRAWAPAFAGVTEVKTRATQAVSGGFWRRYLDPEMERGRALMWVAGVGISGASRNTPSAGFAPD